MNTTQKRYMQRCYEAYIKYKGRSLYDCYVKPSVSKVTAYFNCFDEARNNGGKGGIISYNSQIFVYAYETDTHFTVITKTGKRTISKEDLQL